MIKLSKFLSIIYIQEFAHFRQSRRKKNLKWLWAEDSKLQNKQSKWGEIIESQETISLHQKLKTYLHLKFQFVGIFTKKDLGKGIRKIKIVRFDHLSKSLAVNEMNGINRKFKINREISFTQGHRSEPV